MIFYPWADGQNRHVNVSDHMTSVLKCDLDSLAFVDYFESLRSVRLRKTAIINKPTCRGRAAKAERFEGEESAGRRAGKRGEDK